MNAPLCVIRGGGDLATGVAWRLTRAGWPVAVLELAAPLAVRRTVALSSAVTDGDVSIEGMRGVRVNNPANAVATARELASSGDVAVVVAGRISVLDDARPDAVIDARLAKRNIDTSKSDALLVVGLGPGFTAGEDCHAVVETMRGHRLGRVIWSGTALPNTGIPGEIGGKSAQRVLRAPTDGEVIWQADIGDRVSRGQQLGEVAGRPVVAPFEGMLRGAIAAGTNVASGLKIGDVDPRCDRQACWEISDKSLAVGGGVLEAVLAFKSGLAPI